MAMSWSVIVNPVVILSLCIVLTIIGLPIYLVGCDSVLGGYCNRYERTNMNVVGNQCYLTERSQFRTAVNIGFNCQVYMQTFDNATKCALIRSDDDYCKFVTNWDQLDKCNTLNLSNYPIGSIHPIMINKVDGRCQSPHYTRQYALVGLSILIIAGVLFVYLVGITIL